MGWTLKQTARILVRFRAVLPAPRRPRLDRREGDKWPASIIEDLRRLIQLPYDEIDPESDWLARYLQEGPHGTDRERRAGDS